IGWPSASTGVSLPPTLPTFAPSIGLPFASTIVSFCSTLPLRAPLISLPSASRYFVTLYLSLRTFHPLRSVPLNSGVHSPGSSAAGIAPPSRIRTPSTTQTLNAVIVDLLWAIQVDTSPKRKRGGDGPLDTSSKRKRGGPS